MAAVLRVLTCFVTLSLLLGAVSAPAQAAPAESQTRAIRRVVQDYHARGRFDGVVLVLRRDRVVYEGGFGLADRGRGLPNTPRTPYRICSITKQFTSLLVMQMVQAGRLKLGVVVTDYLPEFSRGTGGKITLKDLLNHTSGLPQPDAVFPGFYQKTDPRLASAAYVTRAYRSVPLLSPPGVKFSYNNADYLVLQTILERVSGQSYARLLKDRILRPLGMQHTGLLTRDDLPRNQARGYVQEKGHLVAEPYFHLANFGAAGAIYSTAEDLRRWDRALDTDRLLSRPFREIMFTADRKLGYVALGSWVYPGSLPGGVKPLLVERDGEIGAFNTLNLRAPDDGYDVILLSNTDTADFGQVYMRKGMPYDILKALYGNAESMGEPKVSAL